MAKKRIEITIGGLTDALDRFEQAWCGSRRGRAQGALTQLTFENLPLLLKNLSPARWALLEQLKHDGPLSINELAKRLARHYKNVHTDVARLIGLGLIQRRGDQRVAVVWDIVIGEMRLAA